MVKSPSEVAPLPVPAAPELSLSGLPFAWPARSSAPRLPEPEALLPPAGAVASGAVGSVAVALLLLVVASAPPGLLPGELFEVAKKLSR